MTAHTRHVAIKYDKINRVIDEQFYCRPLCSRCKQVMSALLQQQLAVLKTEGFVVNPQYCRHAQANRVEAESIFVADRTIA